METVGAEIIRMKAPRVVVKTLPNCIANERIYSLRVTLHIGCIEKRFSTENGRHSFPLDVHAYIIILELAYVNMETMICNVWTEVLFYSDVHD